MDEETLDELLNKKIDDKLFADLDDDEPEYDIEGYDKEGYDRKGFNRQGVHKITKEKYDERGYDRFGYDREGYDREGFRSSGYDKDGYNRKGYNIKGFNRQGLHEVTQEKYDERGYDEDGHDSEGYYRGYDKEGYSRKGFNRSGYDREGYDIFGFNKEGYNREGKTYIEDISKEEAIELLERRSSKPVEAYAILPPDLKRDKDIIITAMSIKGGKRVYEEFVPEECKKDIDIAGIYLEFANYDYDMVPIEIKEKLQNPMEIQEAILKYPGIAMACIDHGDISKIPDELIANPEFIKNITQQAYTNGRADYRKLMSKSEKRYRKIKDRTPVDNIENMIEIYKSFPNDVVFEGTELEENAEFILKISELLVKGIKTPGYSIEKRDGVVDFASNKLLSNPKFMSEAINRGVDGLSFNGEFSTAFTKYAHTPRKQYIKELIEDENYLYNVAMGIDIEKVDIEQLPQELQEIIRTRPDFIEKMEKIQEREEKLKMEELKREEFLKTITTEDLDLSVRSFNILKRAGIHSLQDLLHKSKKELLKFRGMGKATSEEIISKLEEHGLMFNEDGELELQVEEETIETENLQDEHDETETRGSSSEQITAEDKTQEELENMSEEELQQIIANNDQTIEENNVAIKKALVQRILAQQKTISEQQSEIDKLSRQKKEL